MATVLSQMYVKVIKHGVSKGHNGQPRAILARGFQSLLFWKAYIDMMSFDDVNLKVIGTDLEHGPNSVVTAYFILDFKPVPC